MEKAYYIFNGNKVVDVIIGKDRMQQAEITLDLYKNKFGWLQPEIIILDVVGEIHKGYNNLYTVLLNGKPHIAYSNEHRNKMFKYEDSEYRRHTYLKHEILV